MSEKDFDYSEFTGEDANTASLEDLQDLAEMQRIAEEEVETKKTELEQAKKSLREISECILPEAMLALGLDSFGTKEGLRVTLKQDVRASIPKENVKEAVEWLVAHGYGSIVKRQVMLAFGKGQEEDASNAQRVLLAEGYHPEEKTSVHPQTLTQFVRQMQEQDETLPNELLGIRPVFVCQIKNK